jgi:hypothetical protein
VSDEVDCVAHGALLTTLVRADSAASAAIRRACPQGTGLAQAPRHSFLTIVARRGPAIIGPIEARWLNAWHYSHHGTGAYDGGVVAVTPHAWVDFMTDLGGYEPRPDVEAASNPRSPVYP